MADLDAARTYLKSRGVEIATMTAAGLRMGSGEFAGRVVFPWLDQEGREAYATGRAMNGLEPKYRHARGARPGLYASPGAWQASRVALVEGQVDALVCAQGGTSAFATSGSSLSEEAVELLASKGTVILALDADDAGKRLADLARKALARRVELLEVTWPETCKDAADVAARAVEWGADPGEAVAEVLGEAVRVDFDSAFDVLTAREICALPEPEKSSEILGPLIVRGQRVVVGAHTGHGKTTAALQVARAVAHGEEFLGWTAAQERVLIIDAEQGLRSVKRRLREVGLDDSEAVDYLRAPDGLELDEDDDQARALERVIESGAYGLVILDPLYKLHTGDSNDERSAVELMRLFDGWRERFGFCLLLPVHCRKPPVGAKFSMHEFFGSTAYLRGAEVVLGLQLLRPGYSRLHFFKDRDGDLPLGEVWGLLFDREAGYRRDPNDGKAKETATDKLRELLEAEPGMTTEALVEATGYARRTIERSLRDLDATEKAGPHGLKQWALLLDDSP